MGPSIFIRQNNRFIRIVLADIEYIEANRNYTMICVGDQKHSSLHTMLEWEAALPSSDFCRIHRGYIIALDKMMAFDHRFAYFNDSKLPVGEAYYSSLERSVRIMNTSPARLVSPPNFQYP